MNKKKKKIVSSGKNLQTKKHKPSKDLEHEGNRGDGRYLEFDGYRWMIWGRTTGENAGEGVVDDDGGKLC
jgi:hypothetical protein